MIDPAALALVAGGSLIAAVLRSTRADLAGALGALKPMVMASPARDEAVARMALRQVERLAQLQGIACIDRVGPESAFVRSAALKLIDVASVDAFAGWQTDEMEARRIRHHNAAAFWRTAADAAPSMGMIGTVIGLIGMFASLDDPSGLGPAMALAMLTTLYGLIFGVLLFGSAASRLERLSKAELRWQRAVVTRLEALAREEVRTTEQWLKRRTRAAG
ncbi:motility protein A [Allosphingosinicella deserti]|uniref:Flagellar motor protein n=1 Tax=Allosphingosinicella deserti TaxID=2116704 RepID=A0A2P7QNY2_9SPHN|nr:MotA/TolQ/ExbB proton channel family protein [Sphingomonas deserti]PSJ39661.1 flagellar motor protein [Sphingomonas deserti]